jgi:hypothetical protein
MTKITHIQGEKMESKTFEQAEKFYNENKKSLLEILHNEFQGKIDYQSEWDQTHWSRKTNSGVMNISTI